MNVVRMKPMSRRAALRGVGACISLPFLEAMVPTAVKAASSQFKPLSSSPGAHPRMICCYIPQGVNIFNWHPNDSGRKWNLTPTLQPLAAHKSDFTLLTGLGHAHGPGGHQGHHTWLTAANLKGTPGKDYQNSISIDQVAAEHHGKETRFPSLELSEHGALAFNRLGTPLPGEKDPRRVFNRLFVPEDQASRKESVQRHIERSSVLDVVLGEAASLKRRLGRADQRKLEEYLNSVRETERRVQRSKKWISVPRPNVDKTSLKLSSNWYSARDRGMWLDVMLELSYLAFITDTTRVVTFQWSREAGSLTHNGEDHHALSHHGGDPQALKKLGVIDEFHVSRLSRFLSLLKATKEASGSMLDHTMVLYGSGMNQGKKGGHSAKDLPLLLAGGRKLGLKHGQHLSFEVDSTPLSNVLLTMLQKMGIERDKFGDSSGTLTGLV